MASHHGRHALRHTWYGHAAAVCCCCHACHLCWHHAGTHGHAAAWGLRGRVGTTCMTPQDRAVAVITEAQGLDLTHSLGTLIHSRDEPKLQELQHLCQPQDSPTKQMSNCEVQLNTSAVTQANHPGEIPPTSTGLTTTSRNRTAATHVAAACSLSGRSMPGPDFPLRSPCPMCSLPSPCPGPMGVCPAALGGGCGPALSPPACRSCWPAPLEAGDTPGRTAT